MHYIIVFQGYFMSGRISAAMEQAIELVKSGEKAPIAAERTGVHVTALRRRCEAMGVLITPSPKGPRRQPAPTPAPA